MELHLGTYFSGHVVEIGFVALRHDDMRETGRMRFQHFLFQAAKRQHAARTIAA